MKNKSYLIIVISTILAFTTAGTNTKNKLKAAMEAAFGTTATSCNSSGVLAQCYFGSSYCYANYSGPVTCNDGSSYCYVAADGSALCY